MTTRSWGDKTFPVDFLSTTTALLKVSVTSTSPYFSRCISSGSGLKSSAVILKDRCLCCLRVRLSTCGSANLGTEVNLKHQFSLCTLKREESKRVFSGYCSIINAKGLGSAGFRSTEVLRLSTKALTSDLKYTQTQGDFKIIHVL